MPGLAGAGRCLIGNDATLLPDGVRVTLDAPFRSALLVIEVSAGA